MAKSFDLFKLLPLIAVFVYCHISGINVGYSRPENARNVFTSVSGPSPSEVRNQVKKIYDAQVGIKEQTGNNDGKKVEQYLGYVHLKKGQPWCAALVCWVFGQANVSNPRSGWSPSLFPESKVIWQRQHLQSTTHHSPLTTYNSQPPTHNPQPGDVFSIWFPEKKRIAHVGFIDEWGDKFAITVEGNTNPAGSREGDGVYRKRRLTSSLYQVSSWIDH